MKATMITKPTGDVWISPEVDYRGKDYFVIVDSAGQWWGFASNLGDARRICREVAAR